MYEQDFEKSVQKVMEELSFSPSAPVWEAVSAAIGPKRKKRRVVFWLLPFAVAVTGLGWWLWQDTGLHKNFEATNETVKQKGATKSTDTFLKTKEQSTKPDEATTAFKTKEGIAKDGISQTAYNHILKTAGANYKHSIGSKYIPLAQPATANNFLHDVVVQKEDSVLLQADSASTVHKRLIPPALLIMANKSNSLNHTITARASVVAAPQNKQQKKHSSYALSLQLQYGIAGLTEGGFLNTAKSALFDASVGRPDMNSGGGSPFYPSAPRNGKFFSAAAQITRPVYRRFSITTGLAYQQYTQQSAVGIEVSRSSLPANISTQALVGGESFYSASAQTRFTNRYHFISVPILINFKVAKKLPLQVHAGVAVNYLFAAASLQYDTASKVYYKSNALLQKAQAVFTGGIEYRVASGRRWQLLAGPRIGYHFNALRRNASFNNGHLFQYSIGMQLQQKK